MRSDNLMDALKIDEYLKLISELDEKRQDKDSDFDMFYFLTMGEYEDNPYNQYSDAYKNYNEIMTTLQPFIHKELTEKPELYAYKRNDPFQPDEYVYYLIGEALDEPEHIKISLFYRLIENANKRYEEKLRRDSLEKIEVEPLKEVQLPLDFANRQMFNYREPGEEHYLPVSNKDYSKFITCYLEVIDEKKAEKYDCPIPTPIDEFLLMYIDSASREGTKSFDATQVYKDINRSKRYKGKNEKSSSARPDPSFIKKFDNCLEKYSNYKGYIDASRVPSKNGVGVRHDFNVFLSATKETEYVIKNHKVMEHRWIVNGPSAASVFAERTGFVTTRNKEFLEWPEDLYLTDDNVLLWYYITRWILDYKGNKKIKQFHLNSVIEHLVTEGSNKIEYERKMKVKSLPKLKEDASEEERAERDKAIDKIRSEADAKNKERVKYFKKKFIKKDSDKNDPEKKTDIEKILQHYKDKGSLKSFEYDDKNKKDIVYQIKWGK